jgi:HPt (histidine-containing phosphotransfer) domain-containing protein
MSKPIKSSELRALLQQWGPQRVQAPVDAGFNYSAGLKAVDQEVVGIIAEPFLAEWPHDLGRLRVGVAAGDSKAILRVAHSLKGTLAMFGARPAHELAQQMEQQADRGLMAGMGAMVDSLEDEVNHLLVVLTAMTGNEAL